MLFAEGLLKWVRSSDVVLDVAVAVKVRQHVVVVWRWGCGCLMRGTGLRGFIPLVTDQVMETALRSNRKRMALIN